MKKLAFFDIDGTLVPEGQTTVPQQTIEALQQVMNDGVEVMVCTGRCYKQAQHIIDAIGSNSYICSNGQEVCYKGEIIYKHVFKQDTVINLCDLFNQYDVVWGFETRNNLCVPICENEYEHKKLLEAYNFDNLAIGVDHLAEEIYQFWFHCDQDTAKPITKYIEETNNSFFQWQEDLFEVLPGDENKAKAIKTLINYLDEDTITYAFGDGPNDLAMMATVDHSVSMGNAIDMVKEAAEFVTTTSGDNGIVNGLKMVGLLND